MTQLSTIYIESPLGRLLAGSTPEGIALLIFAGDDDDTTKLKRVTEATGLEAVEEETPLLAQLREELNQYFAGKRTAFTVPLAPVGSEFQRAVWQELSAIPYGTTRSYLDQARHLGRPEAVRAVANANGQNRIVVVIPCHRVIGSNGKLTGFTGGLWRKKWLLEHENKHVSASGGAPEKLF